MSQKIIYKSLAQVDETIIAAMNDHALPGLGVGVIRNGKLIYAKGFGLANVPQGKPFTPDTVVRIGSVSKVMTAVGLMQLWEQGQFKLDDPANTYLKAYRIKRPDPHAPEVTFRHLLTHTSGLGELRSFMDLFRPTIGLGIKRGKPIRPLSEYYARGLRPEIYPGRKWAYSNHAFATLGQLIEDISGQSFPAYMLEQVFEPLGMFHTDYLRREWVSNQLAQGYRLKRGRFVPLKSPDVAVLGAGSIFSSVNDMTKFITALLNGGQNELGSILKPETLQMMMEAHYRLDRRLPAMGLGFWLDRFDGHRIAWHMGGWRDFVAVMAMVPDDGLGVFVVTNALNFAPYNIAGGLLRRILAVPDPASRLPLPGVPETPHLWPDLCGFYGPRKGLNTNARTWLTFGGEVEIFVKDRRLALRTLAGPFRRGVKLYRADPDDDLVFRPGHQKPELSVFFESLVFKRNAAGQIDRLCLQFNTFYRRPKVQCLRFKVVAGLGGLAGFIAAAFIWRKLKERVASNSSASRARMELPTRRKVA